VNHDWAQVERVADSVVNIAGRITFAGTPAEVLPNLPRRISA